MCSSLVIISALVSRIQQPFRAGNSQGQFESCDPGPGEAPDDLTQSDDQRGPGGAGNLSHLAASTSRLQPHMGERVKWIYFTWRSVGHCVDVLNEL